MPTILDEGILIIVLGWTQNWKNWTELYLRDSSLAMKGGGGGEGVRKLPSHLEAFE